jgi:hypothetical protein
LSVGLVSNQLSTSVLLSPQKLPYLVYWKLLLSTQSFVGHGPAGSHLLHRPICVPTSSTHATLRGVPQMHLVVGGTNGALSSALAVEN